jgi:peptidoglycan/LPS O-acetylase OafA/YrhL
MRASICAEVCPATPAVNESGRAIIPPAAATASGKKEKAKFPAMLPFMIESPMPPHIRPGASLAGPGATKAALVGVPDEGSDALRVMPLLAVFVLAVTMASGPVARLLSSRPMDWAGRVSYSLYMTHFILLIVAGKVLPWHPWADASLLVRVVMVAGYFVLAYLVAAVTYYLVERPARVLVQRLFLPRRAITGVKNPGR